MRARWGLAISAVAIASQQRTQVDFTTTTVLENGPSNTLPELAEVWSYPFALLTFSSHALCQRVLELTCLHTVHVHVP